MHEKKEGEWVSYRIIHELIHDGVRPDAVRMHFSASTDYGIEILSSSCRKLSMREAVMCDGVTPVSMIALKAELEVGIDAIYSGEDILRL